MLTTLDFIQPGAKWPPPEEASRLERYDAHRRLFAGEHAEVYKKQLERIQREIGNFGDIIGYAVVPNYQRLISLKTADLLVSEPPEIKTDNETGAKALSALLGACNFQGILYQAAIDLSRYGDALLTVRRDVEGNGRIGIGQPLTWFPVVNPVDMQEFTEHVIAWVEELKESNTHKLHIQIHHPGRYEYRVHALANGTIGGMLQAPQTVNTGLPGFAVFPLRGMLTSDSIYGHDDYVAVDSIISEIMVRVGQISRILDKHAAPSMQGPESALEQDANGEYYLPAGNYFKRETKEDAEVGYLTWDGQLDSSFEQLKQLLKQLYALSELGGTLLGDPDHMGGAESARALKLRMINPLAKVARIAANITPALKEAVAACTVLDIKTPAVLPEDISINWFDGLPNDELEDQQTIQLQNGGKPTMSQLRSIMQANSMTEDQAQEELDRIRDESAEALPATMETGMPGSGGDEGNEDDEA